MTKHIVDAIKLNLRRSLPYMRVSKGLSLPVTAMLIFSEILTIPTAILFDLLALKFQKQNLPVLKEEFVDMSLAPKFKPKFSEEETPSRFKFFKVPLLNLVKKVSAGDFEGLLQVLQIHFNEARDAKFSNIMFLHIVESSLRCAHYAKINEKKAQELGLKNPKSFYKALLWAHLSAIPTSGLLDLIACPVQKRGVPILHQDLPSVWPV